MKSYRTIQQSGENEIVIEKSRFIVHCRYVETVEEAENFIHEMKKKYYDATHNVSAYRLMMEPLVEKSSDDREPSGTSGLPMLSVLRQLNLYNVCVVVTRYFGGIKLGKGGLVRAYSQSAAQGVKQTGIVSKEVHQVMSLKMDYTLYGKVKNEVEKRGFLLKDTLFSDMVELQLYVKEEEVESLSSYFIDFCEGRIEIQLGEKEYMERLVDCES